MPEPADSTILKRDPRPGDIQAQVANISAALEDWRRTREYTQATEERLAGITVQCARMVESWQQLEQRGSPPPAGHEERRGSPSVERRVDPDMGDRIRALERTIEHEWEALQDGHNEPAAPPRSDEALENRPSAAHLTLRALANTESRIAALEQELQSRMTQLSQDLQSVLAELRHARPQSVPAATSAFPLESVMRIHEELREPGGPSAPGATAVKPGPALALPGGIESPPALTARVESLERAVARSGADAPQSIRGWRPQYTVLALLAASLAGIVLYGLWMQRRVDTRLNEATVRISEAERQRDETVTATRQEAARNVADARQSANQAQTVSFVLAAPDRLRYWLGGIGPYSRAYGQVMVSRSRGVVFSASRLPAAGDGRTYQLWLRTRGGPVSAGVFVPDSAGRVTFVSDATLVLPGRLGGALVTLESGSGATRPSESKVLIRTD